MNSKQREAHPLGWTYCHAKTYAGDPCSRIATCHFHLESDQYGLSLCVTHFCTQHYRMQGPGVQYDHIEVYASEGHRTPHVEVRS